MAVQYYKLTSSGKIYALDKATGQVSEVSSIPVGGSALMWSGAGLPPDLQSVINTAPTGYYPPTPYNTPQAQAYTSTPAPQAPPQGPQSSSVLSNYYRAMAPGMSGPDVQALQNFLIQSGFQIRDGATGYYGDQTKAAVSAWQASNNIDTQENPGYFGPISKAGLSNPTTPQNIGGTQNFNPNYSMQTGEPAPITPGGTAYNMGATSLVQFSDVSGVDPQTVWWVDNNAKTIRPFSSMEAFNSVYGNNLQGAVQSIQTVHPADLGEGGMFGPDKGYQMLDYSYAIRPDGTMKDISASSSQLQSRYGQNINTAGEQDGMLIVDGFFNMLQKTGSGIDANFLNTLKNDKSIVAFYINAMSYGGYTLSDVYRDIKKRELVAQGSPGADKIMPISASVTRGNYQNTEDGQRAYTDVSTQPPQQIGDVSPATMSLSLYNIPDEAFKTLVPVLDPNSPEFRSAMDNVETAYYDILLQQLTAQTEQEKSVADYNWETFKKDTELQLGIQLSNNSLDAWKQIETARDQSSQAGIQGSGIEQESIDDYLRRVRMSDKVNRLASMSRKDAEESAYYQKYATSAQVQQLIAEDQAKGLSKDQWRATKWGLSPSDEFRNSMSFGALKQQYPNLSDEEINRYISTTVDTNGNYRSALYQKYMTGSNRNIDAPSTSYIKDASGNVIGVNTAPGDYGALDIGAAKESQQKSGALVSSMVNENKAYSEFTKPDSPFLRATAPTGTPSSTTATSSTTPTGRFVSGYNQLQSAVQTQQPAPTPQTPDPFSTAGAQNISKFTGQPIVKRGVTPSPYTAPVIAPTPYVAPKTTTPTLPTSIYSNIILPSASSPTNYTGLKVTGSAPITQTYTPPITAIKSTLGNLWGTVKSWF